ncbi:cytosolic Fe-S cluster assembly factor narfl [Plakobranchus ocellatus]|uniref:Cytosolic Fe-S cluster assembly factor narfl n=1 Tax=Plakobranchus ocellatus TaxID=259542 RepID=A0AAV4C9U5_9GAST|nr:cytosolic Fe-S cluster assembly factor narfl [Plakobranchus ocellatus]
MKPLMWGLAGTIVPGTSFSNTSSLEMKLDTPEHSGDKTRLNDMEALVLSCHKKSSKSSKSATKVMATLFWDSRGMILLDILPKGESVNADRYCETLDRLRHAVRRKRPGLLHSGVVLQHDNATFLTAKRTKEWLGLYRLDIISHPAHSPDFHLFGPLKRHLGGKKFEDEDELIGETHGSYILPYISTTKSPQQIMGSLVKNYFAERLGKTPDAVYHVSVMPCFDKKLEASRTDFFSDIYQTRDVDCVITSAEVEKMLEKEGTSLSSVEDHPLEDLTPDFDPEKLMYTHKGGGSGGYLEHAAKHAASVLLETHVDSLSYKVLRNQDFQEVTVSVDGKPPLKFALAYGFRNIQNIVQRLKRGKCAYHFVEIMACPSGCNNGGGQIRVGGEGMQKERLQEVEDAYYRDMEVVDPFQRKDVETLYSDWLGGQNSDKAKEMLHTQYHEIEKSTSALNLKW